MSVEADGSPLFVRQWDDLAYVFALGSREYSQEDCVVKNLGVKGCNSEE